VKIVGVIPSRLGSTRLARKALAQIAGIPMVVRVYRGARPARGLEELLVATDSEEIATVCAAYGVPTVLTSPDHASGTDRIREIASQRPADAYLNIQGDEPLVDATLVEALIASITAEEAPPVATLAVLIPPSEASRPDIVKVVTDAAGRALYFSRSPIPYDRDRCGATYRKHLGFYAYRREALELFASLPPSPLEEAERLEQLRFLHHGIAIQVAMVERDTFGVDTEEDRQRAERWILEREC
jgi:3-deoxy-manno-octulosonate cytidylyltransferase (CMP-KDO synthetase)